MIQIKTFQNYMDGFNRYSTNCLRKKYSEYLFCCSEHSSKSKCFQCWSYCRYAGGWRLSFPYIAMGVALLMWPHNLWLSYVAGVQLIVLAVLRIFTIFRMSPNGKDEGLLPQMDNSDDK